MARKSSNQRKSSTSSKSTKARPQKSAARKRTRKTQEPMQLAKARSAEVKKTVARKDAPQLQPAMAVARQRTELIHETQRQAAEQMTPLTDMAMIAATVPMRIMHSWTQMWANWANTATGRAV